MVNNGYVYVIGGYTPAYTRDVQYALICTGANNGVGGCTATPGTLGTWLTTTKLLAPLANQASGVYKGYLYNTGGTPDGGAIIDNVSYVPFNANGTLGEWSGTTPLLSGNYLHAATTYNGFIYSTGGTGGLNTTEYAQLKIMPRVSRFSKLIDIGSSASMTGVTYNGTLANGTAAFTYKTWAADGVTKVADSQVATGATCSLASRFVLVSIAVEDAGAWAYYPDNTGNSVITDITVSYTAQAHPQAQVRLLHGKFFDNEQLRPLDTCGA